MSLTYEPASEPLHIYVQQLLSNRELYTVDYEVFATGQEEKHR